MLSIWAFELFFKCGMASLDARNVPLVLIECIRSYLFMSVANVPVKLIALALLTRKRNAHFSD